MKTLRLLLGLGILALIAGCETTGSRSTGMNSSRGPSGEFRGAWVYDPREFDPDTVVKNLKDAGFNAVFVRLSSAGAAYYPSKVLPQAPGTRMDYAQAYADAGRKYGVEVHAWHVCFMMHYAPAGDVKDAIRQGEVMRSPKGKALRPTYNVPVRTPALASNRALERDAMVELVTKYPLDGVQFDYIRYFSTSVDYSATSRAAFEKEMGGKVKSWPHDVMDGRLKERYHQWRVSLISSTVRDASQAIRAANSHARVSAAVWHSPDIAMNDYAQDWVSWVHDGYLDFVVPMNYTPKDERLTEWIENQKVLVRGKIPLYAGLGSYMLNRPEQLHRQIDICRRQGVDGYVLYSYDDNAKKNFFSTISN